MKFRYIKGKNFKDFVIIEDIHTVKDFQLYEVIKKVLYRKEYNPFIKGTFNKTIEYSYLFNDYIFPMQFWIDVKKQLSAFLNNEFTEDKLTLINDPYISGEYKTIDRKFFNEWLEQQEIPEDISIDDFKYIYQRDGVFEAINNRTSRVEIATSGGKTFITYLYCKYLLNHVIEPDKKILVIVPSQLLCTQLKRDFANYDILQNDDKKIVVETIFSGAKKVLNARVVCGTYHSLCKNEEDYFDDFSVMICDELHRAKAYSIRGEIYSKMNQCQYIFGMTGTFPEYKTLDYLHIVAMFGHETVKVTAKELIDLGVANPIKIEQIKISYKTEDEKPVETVYDLIKDLFIKDELCDEKDIKTIVGTDKYALEKLYYQNNKHRTNIISKFINKFEHNSIIFVNTVEYCETLYRLLSENCPERKISMIHGKIKKRDDILDEMRNTPKKYVLVCTMDTMGTGISIKNLVNGYIVDCGKADKKIRQALGRLMRLLEDKPDSRIFDFFDDVKWSIFRKHARERERIYRTQKFPIKTYTTTIPK